MKNIPTFFQYELPNMASHCPQDLCGFSIYRGVLVQWDEDHDDRVLSVLDNMTSKDLNNLLVVQEHKAIISFLWKSAIPKRYAADMEIEVKGDLWVVESKVIKPTNQ